MITILKYITALLLGGVLLSSCNNEPSLQEYLVDKQEDDAFLKVDLATSLLYSEEDKLTAEQKEVLKTVKKVNVVTFPIKDNEAAYTVERKKLQGILSQERYQKLTEIKHKNWNFTLNYVGEDEQIDEVIVYIDNSEKGFGVVRLLGEDMNPAKMIRMLETMDKDNVNLSAIEGIQTLF